MDLFSESLPELLRNRFFRAGLIVVGVLFAHLVMRTTIGAIVRHAVKPHKNFSKIEEEKRQNTLISMFTTMGAVLIWTIGVILVLSEFHVNLAALLTGAGLLGVVFGFGAQSSIKDFVNGTFIILENQFRVGDIITINSDVSGLVEALTIRITKLRDLDGNLHTIANGEIKLVTNRSFSFSNVNIDVLVSYDSDLPAVEKAINAAGEKLQADEKFSQDIIEPVSFLRVDAFSESGVLIKALGKVKAGAQWDTAGEFRRLLLTEFSKHGVVIPLPQLVLHEAGKPKAKTASK